MSLVELIARVLVCASVAANAVVLVAFWVVRSHPQREPREAISELLGPALKGHTVEFNAKGDATIRCNHQDSRAWPCGGQP